MNTNNYKVWEIIFTKKVGKNCTLSIEKNSLNGFNVFGYYSEVVNYTVETFKTFEDAFQFYNNLNTVKKCKEFYGLK